jgi:hypothetical protein
MKGPLIAVAGSALALAVPAVAAGPTPTLRLVSNEPLVVRGTHFRAHERVVVTVRLDAAKRSKRIRSTALGTFRVSFDTPMAFDPCVESLRVSAVGGRGSDAVLKLPQRACPPAP